MDTIISRNKEKREIKSIKLQKNRKKNGGKRNFDFLRQLQLTLDDLTDTACEWAM